MVGSKEMRGREEKGMVVEGDERKRGGIVVGEERGRVASRL